MYILSADTSAKSASVCVSKLNGTDLSLIAKSDLHCTLTHSESLLPMIDNCITLSGITPKDISCCIISSGPGSFTGVRIGISSIKGFAFANDIPCIGVSTLESLAYNLSFLEEKSIICPVMDARRNQFYTSLFEIENKTVKRITEDSLLAYDEVCEILKEYKNRRIVFNGDGAELFYKLSQNSVEISDKAYMYQDAYSVTRCALNNRSENDIADISCSPNVLLPRYLRASQAERERLEKENSLV